VRSGSPAGQVAKGHRLKSNKNSRVGVRFASWIWLVYAALFSGLAVGHELDQSYTFLTVENDRVSGRVELAVRDLNRVLELQWPEDGSVSLEQIEGAGQSIGSYVRERLGVAINGTPTVMEVKGFETQHLSFGQLVHMSFDLTPVPARPERLDISASLVFDVEPAHRHLVVVENHWESGTLANEAVVALIFGPGTARQSLDVSEGSVLQGLWAFVQSGIHHIWIGLDHILFLLALLLPSVMVWSGTSWRGAPDIRSALWRVVKIVTVFTIAHSVTISMSILGVISLSSRLVESIIAISIGIAALNILLPRIGSNSAWVVLAFGLFHGFGFASVMRELAIPEEYLLWSLLGFNVGVEIGQLTIVGVVVPVLFLLRNKFFYPRVVMPVGASALIFVSLYWFVERAFDVDFALRERLQGVVGL
jgi:hypothetical protein